MVMIRGICSNYVLYCCGVQVGSRGIWSRDPVWTISSSHAWPSRKILEKIYHLKALGSKHGCLWQSVRSILQAYLPPIMLINLLVSILTHPLPSPLGIINFILLVTYILNMNQGLFSLSEAIFYTVWHLKL